LLIKTNVRTRLQNFKQNPDLSIPTNADTKSKAQSNPYKTERQSSDQS
jgi:hypothetical protein